MNYTPVMPSFLLIWKAALNSWGCQSKTQGRRPPGTTGGIPGKRNIWNICQWEEIYANANDSGEMLIARMFLLGKSLNIYAKNSTGTGAFSVLSMHSITEEISPMHLSLNKKFLLFNTTLVLRSSFHEFLATIFFLFRRLSKTLKLL